MTLRRFQTLMFAMAITRPGESRVVVLRSDGGPLRPDATVVAPDGRAFSVMGFAVAGGRIVAIDALVDPERLDRLDLTVLDD
jgi:hypothetical protein